MPARDSQPRRSPNSRLSPVFPIAAAVLAAALTAGCVSVGNVAPSSQGAAQAAIDQSRQLVLIPSSVPGLSMRAYLFRPQGAGPFPLAVINHGSEEDQWQRAGMPMPEFSALTARSLAHGYAVILPQRPGHGDTGGPYLETQGSCDNADFARSGLATADSIAAAITYMAKQPFIRPTGVVVVGNSAGGWGALALASRNPANVAAVINFAGGRGGHDNDSPGVNCSPDHLVSAAAAYGRTARIPTLWLYAANDTYFPPALSGRMADAYRAAGGKAEYDLLPAVGSEGHALALTEGTGTWVPYLDKFLAGVRH